MFHSPPTPSTGKPPGVRLQPALAVNPTALASLPQSLLQHAQLLRSGAPALFAAWDQAAAALVEQRTGAVLQACRPSAAAALDACADSVEALTSGLRWSAVSYADAETAVGDRAQVWMP